MEPAAFDLINKKAEPNGHTSRTWQPSGTFIQLLLPQRPFKPEVKACVVMKPALMARKAKQFSTLMVEAVELEDAGGDR